MVNPTSAEAGYLMPSPLPKNDPPQTTMQPNLCKTAGSPGTQARIITEEMSRIKIAAGLVTTCRDRLTGKGRHRFRCVKDCLMARFVPVPDDSIAVAAGLGGPVLPVGFDFDLPQA